MADGSQELVTHQETSPRANGLHSVRVVEAPIALFDTARFEHLQRIATVLATATLVPQHLKGSGPAEAAANCFLVVNQADRWGMDPFAVAQSTYVLHGKIGYEGKLIGAVIEKKLGFKLEQIFFGAEGTMDRGIILRAPDGRECKGTVGGWHTKEKSGAVNSAWLRQPDDQLIYRGTRQWCRRHEPGVMLGVYSDDEIEDMAHDFRSRDARDITPSAVQVAAQPSLPRPKGPPPAPPKGPPPAPAAKEPAPAAEPFQDPAAYIEHLSGEIAACSDLATLEEVWAAHLEASDARLSREDQEKCSTLYEVRKAKVPAVPA